MATIAARTIRTLPVIDLENLASGAERTAGEFLVEVAVDASAWRRDRNDIDVTVRPPEDNALSPLTEGNNDGIG